MQFRQADGFSLNRAAPETFISVAMVTSGMIELVRVALVSRNHRPEFSAPVTVAGLPLSWL
jgi:hypothetical protein